MALPMQSNPNNNEKSTAQKLAENKLKQTAAKKLKGVAKKALKKGARLAIKAAVKLGSMLVKMLLAGASAIGLPTIAMVFGVIVVVIIVSLVASFIFGSGGDNLSKDEKEIYNYIVEKADASVNMADPLQAPYRVPEQLISSVIQIDTMMGEDEKEVIDKMANDLKPTFNYGEFNEWKEWQTQVCTDGECEPWSDVTHEDNWVTKLTYVDYWNGNTTFTYNPYITDWETSVEVEYITETETYTETVTEEWVEYMDVAREETVTIEETYTDWVPYTVKRKETIRIPLDYPPYWMEKTYEYTEEICCRAEKKTREVQKVVMVWDKIPVTQSREVEKEMEREVTRKVETFTKTRYQRHDVTEFSVEDYSTFDSILNSYGLGLNDKRLIEINYMFQDGEIRYTDWLENGLGGFHGGGYFDGTVIPGSGVPTQFMEYYRGAEEKYGVDWYTLAALHFVETGFSTHPTMISNAGAIGHMQFMPATWVGWKYNIGNGLVSSDLDITNPQIIKEGRGYGVDGDGDGKADPWNIADAIYTAANYLASSGYAKNPEGAIFNYNHADWYVKKVMDAAKKYKDEAVYYPAEGNLPPITDGMFMQPATGYISSGFGMRNDGYHFGIDIAKGSQTHAVPVVAAADGIVIRSKMNNGGGGYGNYIILRHSIDGQQYETLYAHLQTRGVSEGQTVKKGQYIGIMGNTGNSTGPHLHFEIFKPEWTSSRSNALNPQLFIQFVEIPH